MTSNEDHLSGEVAIQASLSESGVKASAKSRFVVALDRMFGGLFDIPAAMMEGVAARKRLEDKLKRENIEQLHQIELTAELHSKRLDYAASHAAHAIHLRAAINKGVVSSIAFEELSENASNAPEEDGALDEDWINVFGSYAENASSDRLRELWGKILAGEIRKPGSFSLTTLRVISELDQQTATLFQKHVRGVLNGNLLVKQGNPKGQTLLELTFLEEVGLLQEASGTLGADQEFNEEGNYTLINGSLVLVATRKGDKKFRIDFIRISRSGQEILGILPKEAPDIMLRLVADKIMEHADSIILGAIHQRLPEGKFRYNVLEKIK